MLSLKLSKIVKKFLEQGSKVAFLDIDEEGALKLIKDFKEYKYEAVFEKCDLKNIDQLKKSISTIKSNLGKISVLVNNGPGSFSTIRVALSVAKGIKISTKAKLFGFKNSDLPQFSLDNIEVLISKNLIEKKLIKPLYLS